MNILNNFFYEFLEKIPSIKGNKLIVIPLGEADETRISLIYSKKHSNCLFPTFFSEQETEDTEQFLST